MRAYCRLDDSAAGCDDIVVVVVVVVVVVAGPRAPRRKPGDGSEFRDGNDLAFETARLDSKTAAQLMALLDETAGARIVIAAHCRKVPPMPSVEPVLPLHGQLAQVLPEHRRKG
ncbi:MAG: hypothetical protein MJD61_00845, partial [Proteobacteria bacterium]|nr:hypothetical protein [Pseudomonadota bacterium]